MPPYFGLVTREKESSRKLGENSSLCQDFIGPMVVPGVILLSRKVDESFLISSLSALLWDGASIFLITAYYGVIERRTLPSSGACPGNECYIC